MLTAQEIINDATLTYSVSVQSAKDSNKNKLFEGASYKLYLKANISRSDLKTTMGSESTIYDGKEKKGVILKEYSNQKLMILMSESNWIEKNTSSHDLNFNVEDKIYTVNGFQCKKAAATSSKMELITVFFSPSLLLNNNNYNNCFSKLNGLPVKYERELSDGTTYIYFLDNVNYDIVSSSKFEIPKSGYRVMNYEEVKKIEKERNR